MNDTAPTITAKTAFARHQKPWRNLRRRLPLPADMPDLADLQDEMPAFAAACAARLAALDPARFDTAHIWVAYQEKDPARFPAHKNQAAGYADHVIDALRPHLASLLPDVALAKAHGLYETKHLRRSEQKSPVHTLASRQAYRMDETLSRAIAATPRAPVFIVIDVTVEQGTTMAMMVNYITHNGGAVIGTGCLNNYCGESIKQENGWDDKLSRAFAFASFKRDGVMRAPQTCMDAFSAALKPLGRSVETLTEGECRKLHRAYMDHEGSFQSLLLALQARHPIPRAKTPKHQTKAQS